MNRVFSRAGCGCARQGGSENRCPAEDVASRESMGCGAVRNIANGGRSECVGCGGVPAGPGLIRATKSTTDPIVLCGCNAEIRVDVQNDAAVAMHAVLTDTLPCRARFVPGTLCIDGEPCPLVNPIVSMDLGVLEPGETKTVTYCLRICGAGDACAARIAYSPVGQEWSCATEETRSNFIQIGLSC